MDPRVSSSCANPSARVGHCAGTDNNTINHIPAYDEALVSRISSGTRHDLPAWRPASVHHSHLSNHDNSTINNTDHAAQYPPVRSPAIISSNVAAHPLDAFTREAVVAVYSLVDVDGDGCVGLLDLHSFLCLNPLCLDFSEMDGGGVGHSVLLKRRAMRRIRRENPLAYRAEAAAEESAFIAALIELSHFVVANARKDADGGTPDGWARRARGHGGAIDFVSVDGFDMLMREVALLSSGSVGGFGETALLDHPLLTATVSSHSLGSQKSVDIAPSGSEGSPCSISNSLLVRHLASFFAYCRALCEANGALVRVALNASDAANTQPISPSSLSTAPYIITSAVDYGADPSSPAVLGGADAPFPPPYASFLEGGSGMGPVMGLPLSTARPETSRATGRDPRRSSGVGAPLVTARSTFGFTERTQLQSTVNADPNAADGGGEGGQHTADGRFQQRALALPLRPLPEDALRATGAMGWLGLGGDSWGGRATAHYTRGLQGFTVQSLAQLYLKARAREQGEAMGQFMRYYRHLYGVQMAVVGPGDGRRGRKKNRQGQMGLKMGAKQTRFTKRSSSSPSSSLGSHTMTGLSLLSSQQGGRGSGDGGDGEGAVHANVTNMKAIPLRRPLSRLRLKRAVISGSDGVVVASEGSSSSSDTDDDRGLTHRRLPPHATARLGLERATSGKALLLHRTASERHHHSHGSAHHNPAADHHPNTTTVSQGYILHALVMPQPLSMVPSLNQKERGLVAHALRWGPVRAACYGVAAAVVIAVADLTARYYILGESDSLGESLSRGLVDSFIAFDRDSFSGWPSSWWSSDSEVVSTVTGGTTSTHDTSSSYDWFTGSFDGWGWVYQVTLLAVSLFVSAVEILVVFFDSLRGAFAMGTAAGIPLMYFGGEEGGFTGDGAEEDDEDDGVSFGNGTASRRRHGRGDAYNASDVVVLRQRLVYERIAYIATSLASIAAQHAHGHEGIMGIDVSDRRVWMVRRAWDWFWARARRSLPTLFLRVVVGRFFPQYAVPFLSTPLLAYWNYFLAKDTLMASREVVAGAVHAEALGEQLLRVYGSRDPIVLRHNALARAQQRTATGHRIGHGVLIEGLYYCPFPVYREAMAVMAFYMRVVGGGAVHPSLHLMMTAMASRLHQPDASCGYQWYEEGMEAAIAALRQKQQQQQRRDSGGGGSDADANAGGDGNNCDAYLTSWMETYCKALDDAVYYVSSSSSPSSVASKGVGDALFGKGYSSSSSSSSQPLPTSWVAAYIARHESEPSARPIIAALQSCCWGSSLASLSSSAHLAAYARMQFLLESAFPSWCCAHDRDNGSGVQQDLLRSPFTAVHCQMFLVIGILCVVTANGCDGEGFAVSVNSIIAQGFKRGRERGRGATAPLAPPTSIGSLSADAVLFISHLLRMYLVAVQREEMEEGPANAGDGDHCSDHHDRRVRFGSLHEYTGWCRRSAALVGRVALVRHRYVLGYAVTVEQIIGLLR